MLEFGQCGLSVANSPWISKVWTRSKTVIGNYPSFTLPLCTLNVWRLMPPGRKPLDPKVKAEHRRETLRRYAERNKLALREAARIRMQRYFYIPYHRLLSHMEDRLRAAAAESPSTKATVRRGALKSAARYRDKNRKALRHAETVRRAHFDYQVLTLSRKCIEKDGAEAFDEKANRQFMAKTQRQHEGRPPPPRPRPLPIARRLASSTEPSSGDERDARSKPTPFVRGKGLPRNHRRVSSSPEQETPPPKSKSVRPSRPPRLSHSAGQLRPPRPSRAVSPPSRKEKPRPSHPHPHRAASHEHSEEMEGIEDERPARRLPAWAMPVCVCGTPGCPQCACVCPMSTTWTDWLGHKHVRTVDSD
ncbi:hypothetical protein B0H11DRAFT_1944445 [Mycena galericulata]|nr:hypothetical protein B0H11DRAFT_1944445 [Mycena galericulata]